MDTLFQIDGRTFSGVGVESLKRRFWVTDGPAAITLLSGEEERDLRGTYYGYDIKLSACDLSQNDYDALYEILSAPVSSHQVVMPYGQSTLAFDAMVYSGSDDLLLDDEGTWWGSLTVSIKSKGPIRIPD